MSRPHTISLYSLAHCLALSRFHTGSRSYHVRALQSVLLLRHIWAAGERPADQVRWYRWSGSGGPGTGQGTGQGLGAGMPSERAAAAPASASAQGLGGGFPHGGQTLGRPKRHLASRAEKAEKKVVKSVKAFWTSATPTVSRIECIDQQGSPRSTVRSPCEIR